MSVWRHTTTETSGKAVIGRSTLIVGVLIAWQLSAALPAYAHAALVGSDPADGATLTSPPTLITLTFNEPIDGDFSQVVVLDTAGGHHESGKPHVDGGQVHQEVGPLDVASCKVSYRVGSADGHPVEEPSRFR